jgi:hypothetical protein
MTLAEFDNLSLEEKREYTFNNREVSYISHKKTSGHNVSLFRSENFLIEVYCLQTENRVDSIKAEPLNSLIILNYPCKEIDDRWEYLKSLIWEAHEIKQIQISDYNRTMVFKQKSNSKLIVCYIYIDIAFDSWDYSLFEAGDLEEDIKNQFLKIKSYFNEDISNIIVITNAPLYNKEFEGMMYPCENVRYYKLDFKDLIYIKANQNPTGILPFYLIKSTYQFDDFGFMWRLIKVKWNLDYSTRYFYLDDFNYLIVYKDRNEFKLVAFVYQSESENQRNPIKLNSKSLNTLLQLKEFAKEEWDISNINIITNFDLNCVYYFHLDTIFNRANRFKYKFFNGHNFIEQDISRAYNIARKRDAIIFKINRTINDSEETIMRALRNGERENFGF